MNSSSTRETSERHSSTTTISDNERQRTRPTSGSPFIPTTPKDTDILGSLRRLHADELTWLAQHEPPVVKPGEPFFPKVSRMAYQYVYFLCKTWWRCWWGLVVLPGNLLDKISMLVFAFFASLVLSGFLLWCIFTNIPLVLSLFRRWSRRYAGGLTLVNAAYPQVFHQLSDEQFQISRDALSQPMPSRHLHNTQTRIFNLDIAKILLQCSALMYERTSEPLQGALETTREALHQPLPSQEKIPPVDPSISQPGGVLQTAVGAVRANEISASLHQNNHEESVMASFAARLKIEYATVSELNSQSSA